MCDVGAIECVLRGFSASSTLASPPRCPNRPPHPKPCTAGLRGSDRPSSPSAVGHALRVSPGQGGKSRHGADVGDQLDLVAREPGEGETERDVGLAVLGAAPLHATGTRYGQRYRVEPLWSQGRHPFAGRERSAAERREGLVRCFLENGRKAGMPVHRGRATHPLATAA